MEIPNIYPENYQNTPTKITLQTENQPIENCNGICYTASRKVRVT